MTTVRVENKIFLFGDVYGLGIESSVHHKFVVTVHQAAVVPVDKFYLLVLKLIVFGEKLK